MAEKDKTVFVSVKQVEMISVLPRTLTIKPETMKLGANVDSTMFVVYGLDAADRRVWCATFIDPQEAEAWIHGSKVYGRPVTGAVLAGQGDLIQGGEMSDEATVVAVGSDGRAPSEEPN